MSSGKAKTPSAFKLVTERRAWWPVTFNGVTEEGEVVENRFEMRFTVHGQDEFLALMEDSYALSRAATASASGTREGDGPPPKFSEMTAELVARFASDWRGVQAENGEPLKWETVHLEQVMNVPGVFKAVLAAYKDCREARQDIREGN